MRRKQLEPRSSGSSRWSMLPTVPVDPNLRKNIIVAGVLCLLICFPLIALIVLFDRSIKSTSDATQAAGAPLLGIIPMVDASDRACGSKPSQEHHRGGRAVLVDLLSPHRVDRGVRSLDQIDVGCDASSWSPAPRDHPDGRCFRPCLWIQTFARTSSWRACCAC